MVIKFKKLKSPTKCLNIFLVLYLLSFLHHQISFQFSPNMAYCHMCGFIWNKIFTF